MENNKLEKNFNLDNPTECLEMLEIFLNKANKSGIYTLQESYVILSVIKKLEIFITDKKQSDKFNVSL
jgi:predicted ATPase